jgi:hypothetical protein
LGSNLKLWLRPESLTNPNRLRYTEALDTQPAIWLNSNVTVTTGHTDPNGGSTAFLLSPNEGASFPVLQQVALGVTAVGDDFTNSIYWKRGPTHDGVSTSVIRASDGVGNTDQNVVPPATWERLSITRTAVAGAAVSKLMMYPHNSGTADADNAIYVWHPQLEEGSTASAYKSNTGATVGGIVDQWDDSSGNGHHLVQATQADMPLVEADLLDGFPGAKLDGAGDYLSDTLAAAVTQPFFVGIVASPIPYLENQGGTFISGNAAAKAAMDIAVAGADDFAITAGTALRTGVAAGTSPEVRRLDALFNGASSQVWIDGTSEATGNAGTNDLSTDVFLGVNPTLSGPLEGHIVEVIVFDAAPSAGELAAWQAYVTGKYPSA